ncbi:MAG: tetratricopeptide repeat protein [Candidatus Omnitrophica bacterium]|jgi:tetratricopeptide (TPR) repeat protein|nr:tetratricopeptide repeat protein [Candidatus Omnitrophota bacterium]
MKNKKIIVISIVILLLLAIIYGLFLLRPFFWWCRGSIYEQQQPERAIYYFNKAILMRPDYVEAYFYSRFKGEGKNLSAYSGGLAVCYQILGENDKAREYYNKALELYHKHGDKTGVIVLINANLKLLDNRNKK